jgi:hypothetical protein
MNQMENQGGDVGVKAGAGLLIVMWISAFLGGGLLIYTYLFDWTWVLSW